MNRFEKLGRAIVASIITFIVVYSFGSGFTNLLNLLSDPIMTPIDVMYVSCGVGLFFSCIGFAMGWLVWDN